MKHFRSIACLSLAATLFGCGGGEGDTPDSVTAESPAPFVPAQGILDPTFGIGGIVTTSIGTDDELGLSVAFQPDGRILVAGVAWVDEFRICVVRYLPDGKRDASFGNDGIVITTVEDFFAIGRAMILQPDGRIVVACTYIDDSQMQDVALVRYLPDGSLDPTFGQNGIVKSDTGPEVEYAYAAALQPDGKILVLATKILPLGQRAVLFRYRPNGELDATFSLTVGAACNGRALALQPDGRILIAGYATIDDYEHTYVARLTPDGLLDPSFDQDGIMIWLPGFEVRGLIVQPDGTILAGGLYPMGEDDWDYYLIRLTTSGALDPLFGAGGSVRVAVTPWMDLVTAIALQPDGGILVAGFSREGAALTPYHAFVARHLASGTLDPSFGSGGTATISIGTGALAARSMVLSPDGAIVFSGDVKIGSNKDIALVRLR